jgi:hypothetical protein
MSLGSPADCTGVPPRSPGALKRSKSIGLISAACMASLVVQCSWAGRHSGIDFQTNSNQQSIRLVARLPETVRVAWVVQPVPQDLRLKGQAADLVVLQESWTFARGETLDAQCEVTTDPTVVARLLPSAPSDSAAILAHRDWFLSASGIQTYSLATKFDPGRGSLTDTRFLLLIHSGSAPSVPASVHITVVAL